MTDLLTPTSPATAAPRLGHPRRWAILAVVLAAEWMDLLDGTIVNIAAPSIRSGLGAGSTALQWIVGGYALTFAIGLVTGGRLGDVFGRRRMFLIGVVGFTLSSIACGVAPSTGALIAARLIQGGFAALLIPQGFGIIRQAFPEDERQKAFGMFGPVIGLGAVLGPVLGGLLVEANLLGTGWRLVFLVNAPLGIAALIAALRLLPESRAERPPTIDLAGAALAATAIGLLVYPLIQGRELGWPAWTFVSMAAAVPVLIAFALLERRRERDGRSPLVTPSLFRQRAFPAGLVTALVFFAGMIGLMLTFSLYLQLGLHDSAIHAGLSLIAWAVGTAIGAGVGAGALGPKYGRITLHAGVVVMVAGVLGMLAVIHGSGADLSTLAVSGPELVAGIGMGMVLAPLFNFILASVADDEVGSASGTLNAMQQLGAAVGVAAIGTMFFSAATSSGWLAAIDRTMWVEAGLLAVVFGLVYLLPMRAREDEVH